MTDHTGLTPTRRNFLAMSAALGGVAIASTPMLPADAAPMPDFNDPAVRLKSFIRLRGALDEQLVIGFVVARCFGVVDDDTRPLFGIAGVTFAKYRAMPDGGYRCATYEIPYFTDLETGKALDHWHNPYTGEDVAVPQIPMPPGSLGISSALKLAPLKLPPSATFENYVSPIYEAGEELWLVEESKASFQVPGRARPTNYGEMVTMYARKSDLAHTSARVPCQTAYTSVSSWRSWQNMGDRPGHLLSNGAGGYGVTLDMLPAAWHEAVAARRPEILRDPAGPLAAVWAEIGK